MKIIKSEKETIEIKTVDEWFKHCPPAKGEKQWENGYSAKEMAKFWIKIDNQKEFIKFIKNEMSNCDFDYAIPEFCAKFDDYGKSRQDDLRIFSSDKKTIISIEGKVNESFGNFVFYDELIKSIIQKKVTPTSKKFDRLINLYLSFFHSDERIFDIRYQLLYWFAGAIKAKSENIIMIVQEFRINNKQTENQKQNHEELNKFIDFISNNKIKEISDNDIIKIEKNKYSNDKNLYLGYFLSSI